MQIEALKVFCDLVDTASFSHAAEINGITQSAVSQQIRTLEKKYDVVFFERGKKNFSITPEGQVFNEAAREMVEVYSGIGEQLKAIHDVVSGKLRVATVYSIGLHLLPGILKSFRSKFPEVDVEIDYQRADQVYTDVLEGRADGGLVAYPKQRKGVVVEEFAREKLVLACSPLHPLASRKRVRLGDLSGVEFIGFDKDLPTRKAVDKLLRAAGVSVNQSKEFDSVETVKAAVEVERAVSILPQSSLEREAANGTLVAVEIGGAELWRPLGLVRKRTRVTSPAMREFATALSAWKKGVGRTNGAVC
ncbi:LysR family transcriptional regulator [soil metagenome]